MVEETRMENLAAETHYALGLIVEALHGSTEPFAYSEIVTGWSETQRAAVRAAFGDLVRCGLIERGVPGVLGTVHSARWVFPHREGSTIGAYRLTPAGVAAAAQNNAA